MQRQQPCSCHYEALRVHLEMRHSTSIHINFKNIKYECTCTHFHIYPLLQSNNTFSTSVSTHTYPQFTYARVALPFISSATSSNTVMDLDVAFSVRNEQKKKKEKKG